MIKKLNLPKLMAICALALGLFLLGKNLFLLSAGTQVNGVVVEVNEKKDSRNRRTYFPTVQFNLETGQAFSAAIKRQSANRIFYKVGDEIPLLYPKRNPEAVRHATFFWLYGFPFIFIGLGIILFTLTAVGWERRYEV